MNPPLTRFSAPLHEQPDDDVEIERAHELADRKHERRVEEEMNMNEDNRRRKMSEEETSGPIPPGYREEMMKQLAANLEVPHVEPQISTGQFGNIAPPCPPVLSFTWFDLHAINELAKMVLTSRQNVGKQMIQSAKNVQAIVDRVNRNHLHR